MNVKVVVYGHTKGEGEFKTAEDLQRYLMCGLFTEEFGRYRYAQRKKADIIVVSYEGRIYGHIVVEDMVEPTDQDKNDFPKVKQVYLVKSTATYEKQQELRSWNIKGIQFGKLIDYEIFEQILGSSGSIINHRYYDCIIEDPFM